MNNQKQRVYYRPTTAQQRRLLFETWEATGNVTHACRTAHVSRSTFYHWKERFDCAGYAGLATPASHVPHHPAKTDPAVEAQVIALRRQHGDWGKQRIADELAKSNNWVPVVSPNTVRRILRDAQLWPEPPPAPQHQRRQTVVRTAEVPGQTLNVDLCFVPATHQAEQKLPAVSGSSGRLVVERPAEPDDARQWPGRVFEDESLEYSAAMLQFVAASQEQAPPAADATTEEQAPLQARKRALRQEEAQLRDERRAVRQQRQQEDAAWRALREQRQQQQTKPPKLTPRERKAQDEQWRTLRQQRRETRAQRQVEDQAWREKRAQFRERWGQLPLVTAWIAILVITDNCTRQCLGLPLFVAGSQVTAELIVNALRELLPPELQFLISDRGTHFTATVFQALVRSEGFVHVLIARHRPQSNGIAERFVRTLKEWLKAKSWDHDQELKTLLEQCLVEYNDRPHQGLPIPGLSPNEFAKRIWLM